MLDELLNEVRRLTDGDDDVDTIVRACELVDDGLKVRIEIRLKPSLSSVWTLVARGMRDFEFSPGWVGDVPQLLTAHPVLLPFTEPQSVLHIRGSSQAPLSILGALCLKHSECVGNWLKFSDCVATNMFTPDPWSNEHGIVASGPVTLLRSYQTVLDSYGLRCSIPTGQFPLSFQVGERKGDQHPLYCVLVGANWVVSEQFDAYQE
ncbi:MAG: hypothetical protein DWH81_13855 [Planctomycetota bacterium]|jgi:hypothetical protein|nr:MAG: hypothetical protein DWH81_13855 [Planctomycetota bacterium]